MVIRFFSKSEAYCEFSNFAAFGIELDEAWWPSVEHYYQAQKFTEPDMRNKIRKAAKPVIAKNLARKYLARKYRRAIRPDWDEVKDAVMERAVGAKFAQHEELRRLLLATGNKELEECAPTDTYWGVGCEGSGLNKLGKLIAQIRANLRVPSP